MKYPQVLVYETDGRLAGQLRALCQERSWVLREPRRLESCLQLLRPGGPAVLVLKLGTDLIRELSILERVRLLCPTTAVIVVSDTEPGPFTALAWDLDASFVLAPPLARSDLPELVESLLSTRAERRPAPEGNAT